MDNLKLGPINLQIEPGTITAIARGITLLGQLAIVMWSIEKVRLHTRTNCNRL